MEAYAKTSVLFQPQNMGPSVNSKWEEYLPSISANGQFFVFTRRGPHQEKIVSEDFYASTFSRKEVDLAQSLGSALNTFGNEGAQSLSSDGTILFFTACDREDGYIYGRCDIYVSFLVYRGEWNRPSTEHWPRLTSPHWESQPSISKPLYFVLQRGIRVWVISICF